MQPDGDSDDMSNKRKSADVPDDDKAKQQRRRRRSCSEPRNTGSDSAQKRDALQRLFTRCCSDDKDDSEYVEDPLYIEDPLLLDSVPECMDPEQLGFLLCAQETLRFLRQSGVSVRNPVYVSLRSRFKKAIDDLGIA